MKATLLIAIAIVALSRGAARAQDTAFSNPDFSDSAGKWDIEGVALGAGNTIICKMQTEAENGVPFADVFMLSAGSDGANVVDAYVSPTSLPENSSPKITILFDNKKAAELTGGVRKGLVHADIAKLDTDKMYKVTELFQHSRSLVEVISLKGHPTEKITVDLTDADAAFDKRGLCSKDVLDVGMARMKGASQ